MVYEVKIYFLCRCFSKKLKIFVNRWKLLNGYEKLTFNSKKELNRYINNGLKDDKEFISLGYYYKYSIRVLKGGAKRGKA